MDIVRKWTEAKKGLSLSRRVSAKRRRLTTDTNEDDTVGQCPGNTVYDRKIAMDRAESLSLAVHIGVQFRYLRYTALGA